MLKSLYNKQKGIEIKELKKEKKKKKIIISKKITYKLNDSNNN